MLSFTRGSGMQTADIPFAWVEVQYPDRSQWDETSLYVMVKQHLAALRAVQTRMAEYAGVLANNAQISCKLI